ncbi:hypothetical protein RYH73_23715 [Olivibacter sp. CPCC 100613]|uniref:hypothetical protein n=1 Tax=unclassified Olivibacter TaxID=2632301 RepID=UPI002104B40E|nr:hypothetical protein [Olivibacter sp. SDN3]
MDQETGENVYCTDDETVNSVGTVNNSGKISSKSPLTSTITDELRLFSNFRSDVIGIALKDRSAILPAGHFANAAYLYYGGTGNWVSSSFYMKVLPVWVKSFNNRKLAEQLLALHIIISTLLHIQEPNGNIGKPIEEVIKN